MDNRASFIFVVLCCISDGLSQNMGVDNDSNTFNPDETAEIERPCLIYDKNCIRKFFAEHSHCTISYGPIPDPLYRTQSTIYTPRVNITITLTNIMYSGFNNGRIEEFYINRDTDNLVIAIEFRGLTVSSNDIFFTFHRKGKEPVVTRDSGNATFQSVIITAIIPNIDNLQLDKAEVVAFSTDGGPPLVAGPNIAASSDPMVQAMLAEFESDVPTNVAEALVTEATFYPPTFIQYNICDFGLKVL